MTVAEPIRLVANVQNQLGEGILWHPQRELLYWLDIEAGRLFWCNARGENSGSRELEYTGSATAWIDDGHLLIAADDGIYRHAIDTGASALLVPLEEAMPDNRSNDGRCDPWGRLWVGTMDREAKPRRGSLYVIQDGHGPILLRSGLTVPNSIAFSPDCRRAYYSDSTEKTIFALELDAETGRIRDEQIFATTKGTDSLPDGSVVDTDGFLWNAQWDGWRVVRYRPDGRIDRIVELPVQRPTCPAFGGHDMRTLFIATARTGLTTEELAAQPFAGGILALNTDTAGVPEYQFRGFGEYNQ